MLRAIVVLMDEVNRGHAEQRSFEHVEQRLEELGVRDAGIADAADGGVRRLPLLLERSCL
jgi:hypothetical protein